jgi:hypothetical protein
MCWSAELSWAHSFASPVVQPDAPGTPVTSSLGAQVQTPRFTGGECQYKDKMSLIRMYPLYMRTKEHETRE